MSIRQRKHQWHARSAAGRRDAEAAVRRALDQSRREEREGKVRRFKTARDAVAYLKQL